MMTQDTPIEKHIQFFENKINQYCDVIKANPKGEDVRLWIEHITGWNNEIIELNKRKDEGKNFNSTAQLKQAPVIKSVCQKCGAEMEGATYKGYKMCHICREWQTVFITNEALSREILYL